MSDIKDSIYDLISRKKLKTPLIIAVGFTTSDLNNLIVNPISQKLDLVDINKEKSELLKELFMSTLNSDNNYDYYMIRPEELSLIGSSVYDIYTNDIIVLKNNLYDRIYPYLDTISDIKKAYDLLYLSEDTELDSSNKEFIEKVNQFYGKVDYSIASGRYFVAYKEELFDGIPHFNLYNTSDDEQIELNDDDENMDLIIPLEEDETPFLDFELSNEFSKSVNFVINSVNNIPHHFVDRINILKYKHSDWEFEFSLNTIKRKHIDNEDKYKSILNEVWGYDNFRNLKMYSNIEKHDRNTLEISQAQIIDDIVKQAEKARSGDSYRDIYITSSTGSGKSIMFQIPTLYLTRKYNNDKPLILVISPLIGLMNDQVESMQAKGVFNANTINGNTPPYEKQEILQKVSDGKIDMLYLSPETLQARGDIKRLIGNRDIGMVIVDEAHIVTTWGKSFRADYWYLGIYLQKLRKEYNFPIVTFTATAIYGGREDMYLDIRNSLNMIRPISYFGIVRRNDIIMNVNSNNEDEIGNRDYTKTKHVLAAMHLKNAYHRNQKTLMYFTTVSSLSKFKKFLSKNEPDIDKLTGTYFGLLNKEEKDTVLDDFKSGEIRFVLATKAFGMGIDIPDINNIYHFTPTGNVVDYVQEIGRAARNHAKVDHGFGVMNYLPNDFNAVNQLHGMSAITKAQIQAVMEKVIEIYKSRNNNRNLVVSADDFKYIFTNTATHKNEDDSNLDNKIKTVLLMIEKDFSSTKKLGYSPFVARPRSVFGHELILTNEETTKKLMNSEYKKYIKLAYSIKSQNYRNVLSVNLSKIWENSYKNISFPYFKYKVYNHSEREKLNHARIFKLFNFASGVQYDYDENNANRIADFKNIMEIYQQFLDEKLRTGKQFEIRELGTFIRSRLKISSSFQARSLAQSLINSTFEFQKLKNTWILWKRESINKALFTISQSCDSFIKFVNSIVYKLYNPRYNYSIEGNVMTMFHTKDSEYLDEELIALGIGESFGLLHFVTLGGYNPQIYIRINSIYPIEQAIRDESRYNNLILNDVLMKHKISVLMQKFLFTHKPEGSTPKEQVINYTKWFWNQIENYFMGELPPEVDNNIWNKSNK